MLYGTAGALTFNGGTALESLGVKVKMASISFTKGDNDNVNYQGTFNFAGDAAAISVSGTFSIEELITSCSGLLCQTARLIKGRHQAYENELQRIMGQ